MGPIFREIALFLGICLLSPLTTGVVGSEVDAVSIFNLALGRNSATYTFALNIPEDSNDVYFHLSGPSAYSWVAVGTGSEMKDSLMILLYADATGNNVTVSPRLCTGQKEPSFAPSLAVDILSGTGISHGHLTVNARCSNCSHWDTGSLDMQSTSQPWIYALGPHSGATARLQSDSKAANLERHSKYGRFTMDMVHATGGSGSLPDSYARSVGSAPVGSPTSDSNWPSIIHGLAACVGFILLMPTGVIFLRVAPQNVRWHAVNQSLAAILAILGILIGIYLSTMFNKSESFNSPHQILGFLLAIALVAQWILGWWHHRVYKLTQSPTRYGAFHRYFGHVVVLLAIIDGGIGLTWSHASTATVIGYSVAAATIMLGTMAAVAWKLWSTQRNGKGYVHQPARFREPQEGYEPDVGLREYPRRQDGYARHQR